MTTILGTQSLFNKIGNISKATSGRESENNSFFNVLTETLQDNANALKVNEARTTQHALIGGDLTQLTTETAKLAVSVDVLTGIREKSIMAYQELLKMNI